MIRISECLYVCICSLVSVQYLFPCICLSVPLRLCLCSGISLPVSVRLCLFSRLFVCICSMYLLLSSHSYYLCSPSLLVCYLCKCVYYEVSANHRISMDRTSGMYERPDVHTSRNSRYPDVKTLLENIPAGTPTYAPICAILVYNIQHTWNASTGQNRRKWNNVVTCSGFLR